MSSMGTARKSWRPGALLAPPSDYVGLRVAIFGGTGGLGQAIAQALLDQGAEVTVVGRTLKDAPHPNRTFLAADLSSLATARRVARELPAESFDAVLMTHGIFAGKVREVTGEGLEKDLATSTLSRWVILRELAPRLGRGRPAGRPKPRAFVWGFPGGERAVDLSDIESIQRYRWSTAHSNTVVLNEALVRDTVTRFPEVNVFGMNPGIIKTNIMAGALGEASVWLRLQQVLVGMLFQSPATYAGKVLPALVHPALEDRSGALFDRHVQPIEANPWLEVGDHFARVVEAAEALCARVSEERAIEAP